MGNSRPPQKPSLMEMTASAVSWSDKVNPSDGRYILKLSISAPSANTPLSSMTVARTTSSTPVFSMVGKISSVLSLPSKYFVASRMPRSSALTDMIHGLYGSLEKYAVYVVPLMVMLALPALASIAVPPPPPWFTGVITQLYKDIIGNPGSISTSTARLLGSTLPVMSA